MATAKALMTAKEFGQRPDPGYPEELVQGRIVAMPPPDRRHRRPVSRLGESWTRIAEEHDLGGDDERLRHHHKHDRNTVPRADIAYSAFTRLAKGPLPAGYGQEVPELVIEVRSSGDSWREILPQGHGSI